MKRKFKLITASGKTLNVIDYSGEMDVAKARLIAQREITRKKWMWELHAPHIIAEDRLVIVETF